MTPRITGLAYMKNPIEMVLIKTEGMSINGLIWQRLMMATIKIMGPSVKSNKLKTILLSMIPKSVENLLTRTPEGVESKKWPGLRMIDYIILS